MIAIICNFALELGFYPIFSFLYELPRIILCRDGDGDRLMRPKKGGGEGVLFQA